MRTALARRTAWLFLIGSLLSAGCFVVVPPADTSDPAVTARVKEALRADGEIEVQFLDVDTHVGMVTISGIVRSAEERGAIVRAVQRLPGVKQLVCNVVVRP